MTGGLPEQAAPALFGPGAAEFLDKLVELDAIARAPAVEGVVLKIGAGGYGYAQAWELRQRIEALQRAGKQTVVYLQDTNFKDVYLASAADHVWMLPRLTWAPVGIAATITNYGLVLP